MPKAFTAKTVISASANVKLRSLAGERKSGTNFSPSLLPMEPTPGRRPSQLEVRTKMKIVMTKGKYFSDFLRLPKTSSIVASTFSKISSTMFWIVPGTSRRRRLNKNALAISIKTANEESVKVFVIGKPKIWNIFSALSSMCGIVNVA